MANPGNSYPHGVDSEVRPFKVDPYDREEPAIYGKFNATTHRQEVEIFTSVGPITVSDSLGVFSYHAATLTSGSFAVVGEVASFRVFATGADGAFNINGGDTVTVRQNTGFDWSPRTPVVNPTFNWVSGTLDVFAELAN